MAQASVQETGSEDRVGHRVGGRPVIPFPGLQVETLVEIPMPGMVPAAKVPFVEGYLDLTVAETGLL